MRETLKFTLEVEVDIDGVRPNDDVLMDMVIASLNEAFPSVLFNDDELDCAVITNCFSYEAV